MTHAYFLRHGRSLLNDGYLATEEQNVLCWRGALATLSECEPLKSAGIKAVLSSPIPRAYQTAMLAVGAIGYGLPITLHPELEEIRVDPASETGGHTVYDSDDASKAWKHNIDKKPSWGLESQRMVYARATAFLKATLPPLLEQGSVLVVSHYYTLRGIRAWLEKNGAKHIPEFRPRNSVPVGYHAEDVLARIAGSRKPISPVKR